MADDQQQDQAPQYPGIGQTQPVQGGMFGGMDFKPVGWPDAPQVAAQQPAQQEPQADPYAIYAQRKAETGRLEEKLTGLGQQRSDILNTPLPRPPQPKLQNAPVPPRQQMTSVFQQPAAALILLATLGSGLAKGHAVQAMDAAKGFMDGWDKADQDKMALNQANWQNSLKAVHEQNSIDIQRYNAALNDERISEVERQSKLGAVAAEAHDVVAIDQIKAGDYKSFSMTLAAKERANGMIGAAVSRGQARTGNAEQANAMVSDDAIHNMVEQRLAGVTKNPTIGFNRNPLVLGRYQEELHKEMQRRGYSAADIVRIDAQAQSLITASRIIGNREAQLGLGAQELQNFAGPALSASALVPRGKWVPINTIELNWKRYQSDPNLKALETWNAGLINAYSQVISRTGVVTVHAQERADHILKSAESPEAYRRAVEVLVSEADQASYAPGQVRDKIEKEFMAKRSGVAPPPAAPAVPAPAAGGVIRYDAQGNRVQ